MKILHTHKYYYERAGAERYMLEVMRLQEEAGHTVAPFSMQHPQNLATPWSKYFVKELKTASFSPGLGAVRQFGRAFWSRQAERNMAHVLDVFSPDVVHAHNIYTHLSPSVLVPARQRGIPVVLTVHDYGIVHANYALWNPLRQEPMDLQKLGILETAKTRFIKNSFLATGVLAGISEVHRRLHLYEKNISRFLAVSEFVADVLVRRGIPEKKITVLHNFVDPVCVPRKKETKDVLFVGRLELYKGLGTLIDAMKSFPEVTLRIAGRGEGEAAFRKQAERMRNVQFLGFVSHQEMARLLSEARAAVFPSLWHEPFGLVVAEAMHCGVPVVVSNRGAFPEIVEEGVSGKIFTAGDVPSLVEALRPLVHDAKEAEALGEGAQVRAEQISSKETHLERLFEIYSQVSLSVEK